MTQNDTEARLAELEIQVALQNDLLDSLNDTVARLQQSLDLQQAQLRLLYGRLQEKDGSGTNQTFNPAAEIPPHY
ncbi:SlyX family protein [Eikenella corrodens]|uniref:SlyX family protein n=1 Tax=Eikenella corrodens TaxID=539 RepID=UPI00129AC75D|nr:SlyX family protein [Eikenella corrodens]